MRCSSMVCKVSPSRRFGMVLLSILAGWVLPLACQAADANPPGPRVPLKVGSATLQVELARTDRERETGLMFRTVMGETEGMLFVFPHDRNLRFWMKNTLIPLSIAYIASDGTVKEIHDMQPGALGGTESTYQVRYALELNQGAFARLGIKVGDRMEIKDWTRL